MGTLLVVAIIAVLLGRNVRRLTQVERRIAAQADTLRNLEREKQGLFDAVHRLTDAPGGGVRAAKHRVENIASELYDYFLWVDAAERSAVPIRQVRYHFRGWADSVRSSTDQRTGFAIFERAPMPPCPDTTTVTITLANDSSITYPVDLCRAATIGGRQASAH